MTHCKPFPGCQVRVSNKKSSKYGQRGGVISMTAENNCLVNIQGVDHIFEMHELSTTMKIPKYVKPSVDEPPFIFDKYGQKIVEGNTILYALSNILIPAVVVKLVCYNGKDGVRVRRPDGSMVMWANKKAMMRVVPSLLPEAVRKELGSVE